MRTECPGCGTPQFVGRFDEDFYCTNCDFEDHRVIDFEAIVQARAEAKYPY